MFYRYLYTLVMFLLWTVNGNAHFHHTDRLLSQDENYILVAPHRTFWDPVYMAFAARPKKFIFMAKKELFTNRVFGWWIRMCGAFPIDRENPGTEALRYPITALKKGDRSLLMFPSGSRHSTDVKGGVAVIAKMAKVKIVPSTYVGPMTLKGLFAGERVDMNFGHPIDISDIKKLSTEGIDEVASRIQAAFDHLDAEAKALSNGKRVHPLTYLIRVPAGFLALIILLLTIIFSYLASFVWKPKL